MGIEYVRVMKWKAGDRGVTRQGDPFRVICADRIDDIGEPIMALVMQGGKEHLYQYQPTGSYYDPGQGDSVHDLGIIPETLMCVLCRDAEGDLAPQLFENRATMVDFMRSLERETNGVTKHIIHSYFEIPLIEGLGIDDD